VSQTHEIVKITEYTHKISAEAMESIAASVTCSQESKAKAWMTLTETTLAQLILFNHRRVLPRVEVSKVLITMHFTFHDILCNGARPSSTVQVHSQLGCICS